jgi:solute carrier family 35 protein
VLTLVLPHHAVSAIGSVVAGATDAAGDMRGGYALVLLQNVCSACSLAFSKESALSSTQLMALNSAVGVLCCSWLALWLEWPLVRDFPHAGDPVFVALLLSTCAMCVLYQFSVYNCTLRTSALTTSVTGNIKDLAATVGGFLLFPDAHLSAGNVAGVALSFLGAYSFSYARYRALTAGDKPKSKQR